MGFSEVISKYGFPIISKEVSECIDQARKSKTTGKYLYRIDKLEGTAKNKSGEISAYNMAKWKFLIDDPFKISNKCCSIMKKTPAHNYYKKTALSVVLKVYL